MDNTNSYSKSFCGEYRVKHILIKPIITNNMDASQVAQAKQIAKEKTQDIILKLMNGGNWSSLVKKYSEDKLSAQRDGLMKNFRQGEVEDVLFETVEKLIDGRYTEYPIEASDGYHILLRVNKTEDEEETEAKEQEQDSEPKEEQQKTETQEIDRNEEKSSNNSYDYVDESQSPSKRNKKKSYGISDYDYDSASEVANSIYLQNQFSENTIESQIKQSINTNVTGQSEANVNYSQNVGGSINENVNMTSNQNTSASMDANIQQNINVPQSGGIPNPVVGANVSATVGSNTTVGVEINRTRAGIVVGQTGIAPRVGVAPGVASQNTATPVQTGNIVSGAPIESSMAIGDTDEPTDNLESMVPENLNENTNNLVSDTNKMGRNNGFAGSMNPQQALRNSGKSSKLQERLERSRGKNLFNNLLNRNRNQDTEELGDKKDNPLKKAGDSAVGKGLSKLAKSKGVPKELADKVRKELAGPLLDAFKKKYRKYIIIGVSCALAIFLIVLTPIIILAGDSDYQAANSEERSNYLYGSGTEEDLYEYLKDIGACSNYTDCASSDAATFYKTLKSVLNDNSNLTERHADSFIIKMIFYKRTDKEAYKHYDEIEYIANIIGSDGSFNIANAASYKEAFVSEGGYFDTYRADLLVDDNSIEYKEKLYDEIVQNSTSLINRLESNMNTQVTGGVCSYSVNGKNVSNLKVRLLQCKDDTRGEPIAGEELVDFEKYILGVVYAENGNGSTESMKAQAIAARTYALLRPSAMGGAYNLSLEQENGEWILSIRNCTEDQVYCDPDKGCWSNNKYANGTVHSGYDSSKNYAKGPLAQDSAVRTAVAETVGKVLLGADGNLFYTNYTNTQQQIWNNNAKDGKDHFELLKITYPEATKITSTCTVGSVTGEFTSWKQYDQTWAGIPLGTSSKTIKSAGCLVTSIAIQIAKSGTTINLSNFNPGTFVQQINASIGFDGPNYYWNSPVNSGVAPNFVYKGTEWVKGSLSERAARMQELQNQGYYIVIQAKTDQHWVALDHVEGEKVYINDPGSNAVSLWDKYPPNAEATKNGTRISYYINNG